MQYSSLKDIFTDGVSMRFERNDIIVRPEEPSSYLYMIVSGFVNSYGLTKEGNTNIHIMRGKDSIFPLISAYTGVQRDIYFSAMNSVVVQRLSTQDFFSKINDDPKLLKALSHALADLYLLHTQRVDTLEYRTARDRVISRLINLADRFGIKHASGILINAPIHHHDIADSANMSRETASREISQLEKRGLLEYHESSIVLTNIDALRDIL